MKTEQQTEQQRIERAIDTALLNADLLREQVAELEAENAELRGRVCVPYGWMVVPSQCTSQMEDAYDQQCADDNAYGCSMHLPAYEAMLTAVPAPVERVEQDHDAIALDKARNIMQIMYGEMPKGGSTQLLAMVQVCVLEAMSRVGTPQPAAPAPGVAGLEFTLAHPDGEKHTVMLTKDEVQQYMVDEIYEKLGALVCSCEPVGESSVCDCNCIDRIEQFEIAAHQQREGE